MMKLLMTFLVIILMGCNSAPNNSKIQELEERNKQLEAEFQKLKDKEESDMALGQYVINMTYMTKAGRQKSDAWKMSFARDFVEVANNVLTIESLEKDPATVEVMKTLTHKEKLAWVRLQKQAWSGSLAIESAFNRVAQSHTGPKGYGQLARASFHEAMKMCGMTAVDDDVWETKLNLYASACYYKKVLMHPKLAATNDVVGAMIGYNQGMGSKDFNDYLQGGMTDGKEPLKYALRAQFLLNRNNDQVKPGVTSLKDIPTPELKATTAEVPVIKNEVALSVPSSL